MANLSSGAAKRQANQRTVQTGRVHTVTTRRGFFGSKSTVTNTGRIADPVQRRNAISGR